MVYQLVNRPCCIKCYLGIYGGKNIVNSVHVNDISAPFELDPSREILDPPLNFPLYFHRFKFIVFKLFLDREADSDNRRHLIRTDMITLGILHRLTNT